LVDQINRDRVISKISELLSHHLGTSIDHIAEASRVMDAYETSSEVEELLARDIRPSRDIKALDEAAKKLLSASEKLAGLGLRGANALRPLAGETLKAEFGVMPVFDSKKSNAVLAESIAKLAAAISEAANTVDPDAYPMNAALTQSDQYGKGGGDSAEVGTQVAVELGRIYENATGRRATVTRRSDLDGEPRSGPFFELVSATFDVLSISASPGTRAEAAARRIKASHSPNNR
jgi:hypothetical protein